MISKRDLQLGKIALRAKMITKDQLKGCLALQKKLVKTKGKKVALGALLLKKGYLTEEQLQEIVKQHNERAAASGDATASEVAEATGGASGETGQSGEDAAEAPPEKKSKKKAGSSSRAAEGEETATATKARREKTSARLDAEEKPGDEDAAERKRHSREVKRSRAGGSSRGEPEGKNGAGEPPTEGKRSKRLASAEDDAAGDEAKARKDSGKSKKGDDEPAEAKTKKDSGKAKKEKESKKSTESEVDPAIFASAPEDAVDEDDRRLVACPECGKKYRIRQSQVGKRFGCRRCKNKVKVPKDLFSRPLAPEAKGGGGVEPEEFTLGSSDQTEAAPVESEPSPSVRTAAAKAAVAIQRVQAEPSIKDLAKAAQAHQKKGLPPRTRFGVKQALTLVASFALLAGFVGGGIVLKQQAAAAEAQEKQDRIDKEFEGWRKKVDDVLARAEEVARRTDSISIDTYRGELRSAIEKKNDLVQGSNNERAAAYLEEKGTAALLRDLLVKVALALKAERRADESIGKLKEAAKGSKDPALLQIYGRALIEARSFREAAAVLDGLAESSPSARALRAYALERGDAGSDAAKVYGAIDDPLAPVFVGRAYVVNRSHDQALEALAKASGLTGQALAAAKVVEAAALEQKGDPAAAERALRDAAAAAPDSPFPQVALGELLLRTGKVQEAVAALEAAKGVRATARGYLALGDAFAAQLELERARTVYRDASTQPLVPEGTALLAGELDPFEAPHAVEPRAMARVRLAALDRAAGNIEGASLQLRSAEELDAFSPDVEAEYAALDLKGSYADARLQRALKLLTRVGGTEADLVRSPSAARVLLVRGAFLVQTGKHAEAIETLAAAVATDPGLGPQADTLKGQALEATSQHTRAYDAYAEAARGEITTAVPGGREYLAAARRFEEKPDDPAELSRVLDGVTAALALNPYHARAHLLRARVLVKQGKSRAALADLERAIVLNKYLRDAYVTRGYLYVRDLPEREQTSETTALAKVDFETALKIEQRQGGERAETHCGLALVFFLQNDLLRAHEAADKCLQREAQYAEGYRVRAMIRARQGNAAGAQADTKQFDALKKKG